MAEVLVAEEGSLMCGRAAADSKRRRTEGGRSWRALRRVLGGGCWWCWDVLVVVVVGEGEGGEGRGEVR